MTVEALAHRVLALWLVVLYGALALALWIEHLGEQGDVDGVTN